ncbi:MAG: DEAD/DEAH box helicase family protein [Armatimonadota bacterium]|nr:DEAD/DEAH box helicase family protein [Armatimonadota bacterium]MDR7536289.1 DEAD/DEAH box helicase family protein [Armatimonadota bacterium]
MTPPARLRFERGSLRLDLPRSARVPPYLVWDGRVGAWRTEARYYGRIREDAASYHLRVADEAAQFMDLPPLHPALPPLRADQQHAVEAWERAGGRGVVVKPTGTGKTEIALAIVARHRASALIVVPLRDLMYQWQRRIRQGLGVDAGLLGDGHREILPVTVTTYDSAYIHMKEVGNRFRLVVYDEAHHLPAPALRESALDCLAPLRLGLTATPWRADGAEGLLGDLIGPVVYAEQIPQARGRTLAAYTVIRVPIYLTDTEQAEFDTLSRRIRRYVAGWRREQAARPDRPGAGGAGAADGRPGGSRGFDWTHDLAVRARTDPEARAILRAYRRKLALVHRSAEKLRVVEDILRLHAEDQVVIFTASTRMALEVSARFLVPALTSSSPREERYRVLDLFARGTLRALVACEVLNEGWDAPAVKVGVVLGGEKGTREAVQRIGRLLRKTGDRMARLYEVVVQESPDVRRARRRSRTDAYQAATRLSLDQARQLDLF